MIRAGTMPFHRACFGVYQDLGLHRWLRKGDVVLGLQWLGARAGQLAHRATRRMHVVRIPDTALNTHVLVQ